jgi:hypothetical protein
MEPVDLIPVGTVHSFELLKDGDQFAVYKKSYQNGTGKISYIIARIPSLRAYSQPPASALMEFGDKSLALATFERWKQDPLLVSPKRARKKLSLDPAQTFLNLEFRPREEGC